MNSTMAMPINQATLMAAPVFNPNIKDSRWLTLEVCREYTRNKCSRSDEECKFAHPPPHVEVQNGRVTCCFDSIKGKCQRKDPPCKYLHPPQHLKEQLLQNGRNNLILKNLQMQALAAGGLPGAMVPGLIPTVTPQYLMQHTSSFNPYINNTGMGLFQDPSQPVSLSSAPSPQMHSGVLPPATASGVPQKVPRPDRLESSPVIPGSSGSDSNCWNGHASSPTDTACSTASQYNPIYFQPPHVVEVLNTTSKKRLRDPADDLLLSMNHVQGMVPIVKRPSTLDGKSGIPMYQHSTNNASAYQQALAAMQLQQPYAMQSEYIAGHPPSMQRF